MILNILVSTDRQSDNTNTTCFENGWHSACLIPVQCKRLHCIYIGNIRHRWVSNAVRKQSRCKQPTRKCASNTCVLQQTKNDWPMLNFNLQDRKINEKCINKLAMCFRFTPIPAHRLLLHLAWHWFAGWAGWSMASNSSVFLRSSSDFSEEMIIVMTIWNGLAVNLMCVDCWAAVVGKVVRQGKSCGARSSCKIFWIERMWSQNSFGTWWQSRPERSKYRCNLVSDWFP